MFPKTIYREAGGRRGRALGGAVLTALIVLGLGVPRVARADQLVVKGENHLGAKVLNLEEGQLSVRLGDGRVQGFRIDEIDLLIVDRGGVFEDFNQADRFLSAGEAEKAAVRFERALRLCSDFWPDVCAARLVKAYDRTGQLDKATLNFIRLARGRFAGPAAAARLIPQNVPARRDAKFTRAVDQLDSALAEEPGESRRVLFEALRYEILRRTGDDRTGRSAEALAVAPVPADVRSEAVYALVQLALREAFTSAPTADRWAALDRAIADCPKGSLPGFFLLKGDVMLSTASSRDDLIRASWPFLRIAAHAPDDPRAADGLLGGATVLERIGRADQAIGLLEECLGQSQVGDETRRRAEESLTRLRLAREGSDASEKVKR